MSGGVACGCHSLLSPLPHHGDPLAVLGPGDVLDLPSEGLVLVLQQVLFLRGVPDPDLPRHICSERDTLKNSAHTHPWSSETALTTRRDVKTAGRVFGHDNLMRMLGVDVCDRWVLQERERERAREREFKSEKTHQDLE